MATPVDVYVESGTRRVFAGAVDWPGWARSAKDEDGALKALAAYGGRYRQALGNASRGVPARLEVSGLKVVERVKGDATTDFGAPSIAPSADEEPVNKTGLRRLTKLLEASWDAFDDAAAHHAGVALRKGPRGGGREVDAIVAHVFGADGAYLRALGGRFKGEDPAAMAELRAEILDVLAARARGEPPPPSRRAKTWTPRYFVRRSSWHALDHAWEIEDRAMPDE